MELLADKQFPQNYSSDAVRVLRAMSLTDGHDLHLVGSMSLRSQQYAGDFDAYENVRSKEPQARALASFAAKFKNAIKQVKAIPDAFVADIKAGVVEEWRVIPAEAGIVGDKIVGFNLAAARAKVDMLVRGKILGPAEGKEAHALLKEGMGPAAFLVAKDAIRPHIVRWTPAEVLQGFVVLKDGRRFTLEDAFTSRGLTKLDVIAWMNGNHFAEFSCIYNFYVGDKWINAVPINLQQSLQEDITSLLADGKPFKAMKRRFVLAKLQNDVATLNRLQPILNGDLGRIYSLMGDIGTILYMLEHYNNLPQQAIDFELDQFRDRFSRIYGIKDFIYAEPAMLGKVATAMRAPRSSRGRALMAKQLRDVEAHLQEILATHTPKNV